MKFASPLLLVAGLLMAGPAAAASLCDSLFVPDGYALDCRRVSENGKVEETATVTPTDGAGADLVALTVRELDRATDGTAWSAPQEWLRSQVTVDVGGLAAQLRRFTSGSDSPLSGPTLRSAIEGIASTLERWGRAPLESCVPATPKPGRSELDCTWSLAGLQVTLVKRLVAQGDRRYELSWRGGDRHSVDNLEAVANSFRPG